ncbi:superoxide dismutase [Cu-Zn] [Phascolomyces articulosus]|uniref:Superoxide dismutase [Cu-Zn] n=1 Tax=Phascolomyces articulosus TaxID=60185 RepID=A0AAD5PAB9_9FUNG|nr:superoxide dismutase [Cu-Zn] [Phascolomyces articulosus]
MVNAVAILKGAASASAIVGSVWFTPQHGGDYSKETTVYANVTNVPAGKHGFHIHEFGDLSDGCESLGGHFNPFNMNHGSPEDHVKHVGDFGNVDVGNDGTVHFQVTVDTLEFEGPNSILGRGIILHADQDDLGRGGNEGSRLVGNSGARIACGIIGNAAKD